MSVRHIHARPEEYIAVHRSGDAGSGEEGCLILFVCLCVIYFWKVLLRIALGAAAIWLMWVFRSQLWKLLCWICKFLLQVVCFAWKGLKCLFAKISNAEKTKSSPEVIDAGTVSDMPKKVKIIQHRRR